MYNPFTNYEKGGVNIMVDPKNNKTGRAIFKTLQSADPLKIGPITYFVSLQEIKQEDTGNVSIHLVIKKQAMNEDGSPRGQSKQVFIPQADANKVLKHANDFLLKQKA